MSRAHGLAIAAVVTALGAAAAPAAAQGASIRVAVVNDLVANVKPDRAAELGGALADALERELVVDAIGGADVARRLPATGVPDDCLAIPGCISELAHRLDATQLLFLAIVQVGTTVQIDATWVDAATGESLSRPRVELPADARAGEVFSSAAPRLLPQATKRASVVVLPPPSTPRARRHMTPTTWALGGAAVVGLGVGIGLGLSSRATYQRCDRNGDACDADERDSLHTRALVADLAGGIGIVAGGAALVMYLRSTRVIPAPVQAWITPQRSGATADVRLEF